jgi:hypothetical protein
MAWRYLVSRGRWEAVRRTTETLGERPLRDYRPAAVPPAPAAELAPSNNLTGDTMAAALGCVALRHAEFHVRHQLLSRFLGHPRTGHVSAEGVAKRKAGTMLLSTCAIRTIRPRSRPLSRRRRMR